MPFGKLRSKTRKVIVWRIIHRDGLRCRMGCGRWTNPMLLPPDPLATTIDHVGDGRNHRAENLRIACFECNNGDGNQRDKERRRRAHGAA